MNTRADASADAQTKKADAPADAQPKKLRIMLVCGEPSGDALGAQLMAGLKRLAGDRVQFTGVGGLAMAREGLESLYPLNDTAVIWPYLYR